MTSIRRQSQISSKDDITLGSRVLVNNDLAGTIKYIGTTSFQTGKWIGVELDEPEGKNSGVVQGKRYFECKTNHGVFTRSSNLKILEPTRTIDKKTSIPNQRKKSIASPVTQRKSAEVSSLSSVTTESAAPQRSKSILDPQRRKSIVEPQRRKSIVEPQRQKSIAPSASIHTRKQMVQPQQKRSLVPPKVNGSRPPSFPEIVMPSKSTLSTRRPTAINQKRTSSILKPRTPITAPSTPDSKVEDIDALCNENTLANSETMSSPVSIGKEDKEEEEEEKEDDDDYNEKDEESEYTESEEEDLEEIEEKVPDPIPEPVYGSLASKKPINISEQTVPLKQYEELRIRLKIMENKRHEDRERFREHEKIKEEAEQFLTLRNKLQDKISELQKDVREARRELRDVGNEKEEFESQCLDLIESMEILTVDKEVAEEHAESYKQEAEMLKDRIKEISIDLDVLKTEADLVNRPPSEKNHEEKTSLDIINIERHNEQLRMALFEYRDMTNKNELKLSSTIKTLEKENRDLQEIKKQYEKVKEQLASSESLVENLKIQLDDAMGSQDLVEKLTEKNLNLNEKMEELKMLVEDLEAFKELGDELEENHIETEKQLQAEIDHRDMLLREQMERLKKCTETIVDCENTVAQYRELVKHLQNDIEELRQKDKLNHTENILLSSQSQAMLSLNNKLKATAMKAQAKSIDIELRKLDAIQANDRLNMIQPYLPEAFFKSENDPISCLLLFKRLEFKSDLIIKHLDQTYPISEKIMENVTENLITMCEIKQKAGWLSSLSNRFQTHIKNCEPDAFTKIGRIYHDLIGIERKMNSIVERFRTDHINEPDCLIEIQKIIYQMENLVENSLGQEKSNANQFFGLTKALDLNSDRMLVIFTFTRQLLINSVEKEGLTIYEGVGEMERDYMEPLGRLIEQSESNKVTAKKLVRQLEDMFEEAMTLKKEYLHRFKMLYSISTKVCRFCFDIYKELVAYVDKKKGTREPIELSFIKKLLQDKGDEIFEMVESSMWESSLRTLKSLKNELDDTHNKVGCDENPDKITTKVAPWIQRASDIKAELVINHEMEHKLQQYSDDVIKLMKDIKLKDQSLQESDVKINLLQKRMEIAREEIEHARELEEEIERLVSQGQQFEEAIEALQNENETLEADLGQLKKEASKREEKRKSLIRNSKFDLTEQEDTSTMQEMASNYYEMSGQIDSLKSSIRFLRSENAHLKSSDYIRSLGLSLDLISEKVKSDERLKAIARETRVLLKDIRITGASPRIVQLSNNQNTTDYHYQTQQSVMHTLKQRSIKLRSEISDMNNHENTHKPIQKLGLIKIPNILQVTSKHAVHLKSAAEFKRLHSLFMQP